MGQRLGSSEDTLREDLAQPASSGPRDRRRRRARRSPASDESDHCVQAIPSFEFAEHPVDVAGGVSSGLTISQLSDRDRGPHRIDRNRVEQELDWSKNLDRIRHLRAREVLHIAGHDGTSSAHVGRRHDVLVVEIRQSVRAFEAPELVKVNEASGS